MLKLIIDQLRGIGGSRSVGLGPQRVISMPDAVAGALVDHYLSNPQPQQLNLPMTNGNGHAHSDHSHDGSWKAADTIAPEAIEDQSGGYMQSVSISGADICPSCGNVSLLKIEGCEKCDICGYSRC
jgi:ribonucleoside-diphosphate reductase alpha chain